MDKEFILRGSRRKGAVRVGIEDGKTDFLSKNFPPSIFKPQRLRLSHLPLYWPFWGT